MDPHELRKQFNGVIAFPVTPFNPDLSLNLAGLQKNLEHLLEYPICAVIAAGGTGEMYSLTPAEQLQVVRATVAVARRRVPVLTAVGFNQQLAVEMAQQAAVAGVDGILAFPPYYPNAETEGLLAYYQAIGKATALGLAIYARDWAVFNADTVAQLAKSIPTLVAWKDGHGDMRRYQLIMDHVGERLHWIGGAGDDLAPSYYGLGIRTYTSSLANIAPQLSLQLHELASRNDTAGLAPLLRNYVIPHYDMRARRKGYEVSVVKAQMDLVGLHGGPVRPPLVNLRAEEVDEIRRLTDGWRAML